MPQAISENTPVIIGVAQFTERSQDPGYEGLSPVAITAKAAGLALVDAGLANAAAQIDTVMTTRIFEDSAPVLEFPFGRSNNFPRSVCRHLGIAPETAIWATVGGDTPQKLVTEACDRIATGLSRAVLIAGGEALSTSKHLKKQGASVDWSETLDEPVEDRGAVIDVLTHDEIANGLISPPLFYGFIENARRIAAGKSQQAWLQEMGALFAPFAAVAADNPLAARHERAYSAEELVTPGSDNRLIASPYTQRLVARDQVNQSAALVVVASGLADELAVPPEARIYLHGQAAAGETPVSLRPDIGEAPSAGLALSKALERAMCQCDDITFFDFYSCFPVAVSNAIESLGLAPDDPRGLTVTGGLPYFGGPGNSYSMHALAEMVSRLRARPGARGLVAANGGFLSKYAVGVYSTMPAPHDPCDSAELDAQMAGQTDVVVDPAAEGSGAIEAYTVAYDRESQAKVATIAVRLENSERRFLASVGREDPETLAAVTDADPGGRIVTVAPGERGGQFRFVS